MPKMNDDHFRSVIDQEVSQSVAWSNSVMADDRERNHSYYHGQPMGNEVEGRSQVVSWDVFEVVESALPSLLEPFFAGDDVGEFEPVGKEDEAYCEQATDYVNYLIKKRNEGFLLFNTWVKDGMLSKVGIVRAWWDARVKTRKEEYTGLTDEQVIELDQQENITILTHSEYPDPDDTKMRAQAEMQLATLPPEQAMQVQQMLMQPPKMLHDVELSVDCGPNGVTLDNVPPETFIISRKAKRLKDSPIIGELRRYTRSDLVEMGFNKKRVEALSDYDISSTASELMQQRDEDGTFNDDESADSSLQEIAMFFGFVRVDYDGDGIAEWRRVFLAGNDILENEVVTDHEYCIWSPIILPHRVIGMAYADPLVEIQNLKTALTRQYLDSLYLANNPATYAVDGQVNLDDLLSTRIGRVVRMKAPNMAGPLQTTVVANESLQGIQLADTMRENRIGVTKYNQGLDADSLNKTAHGVERIMTAAEKRLLMTLRIFAETGVKDLFKKVLKLICEYQDKPATVRLRNKWVDYDPRNWSSEMDVTVNVGLGSGNQAEMMAMLDRVGMYLEKVMPMGLADKKSIYNLGKLILKNSKIQGGTEMLLIDPATQEEQPPQEPQPSPDAMVLAQSEIQKAQIKADNDYRIAQMETNAKVALEREKMQLEHGRHVDNALLRQQEIDNKAQQPVQPFQGF